MASNRPWLCRTSSSDPASLVLKALYTTDIHATGAGGAAVTGTAVNSPTVSGGYLVLNGSNQYVTYPISGGDTYSITAGTIIARLKWNDVTVPGVSGYNTIFWPGADGSNANSTVVIWYNDAGTMKLVMYHFNSGGGAVNDHAGAPAWSPANTTSTYEIAMTYDLVGNVSRLFVDGVLLRTWSHGAAAKVDVAGKHWVATQLGGANYLKANVDSYRVYNAVLWTSDYTPG
jgi:hypothetical protein